MARRRGNRTDQGCIVVLKWDDDLGKAVIIRIAECAIRPAA